MIERSKCCKAKYDYKWYGLKLYAVCSKCDTIIKTTGKLYLFDKKYEL